MLITEVNLSIHIATFPEPSTAAFSCWWPVSRTVRKLEEIMTTLCPYDGVIVPFVLPERWVTLSPFAGEEHALEGVQEDGRARFDSHIAVIRLISPGE
jgi:hypothetical protein